MKSASLPRLLFFLKAAPPTLGLVCAAVVLASFPELRTALDMLLAVFIGTAAGLVVLSPVAAAVAFRRPLKAWVELHGNRAQRQASILMALALGYVFGSIGHQSPTRLVGVALLMLYLAATAKIVCAVALTRGRPSPPSDPEALPPLAPVIHPTGGSPCLPESARALPIRCCTLD